MIGYLLGIADKKTVVVKIDFNESNSDVKKYNIVDKDNATYMVSEFKIIDIFDEKNKYISVDLNIIIDDKFVKNENLKINQLYDKKTLFFYLTQNRALQDKFLYSKATGTFRQYLPNGDLANEISYYKGKLDGKFKIYENGVIIKEEIYKCGVKI